MVVTWQTVITAAAVVAALAALARYFFRGYDFIQKQKKQDEEIKSIKEELQLLTYGSLACLKGLKEQGCDGAVSDAIDKMEKHLNAKAHSV